MGGDESHFNVSLIVRGQSQDTVHNLFEEKGEPKRNRADALLLTSLTPYRLTKPAYENGGKMRRKMSSLYIMVVKVACEVV